ncbi:unnamed protein product [Dibothriocephalus latus]|uniref:Uncharacterized protein n=1 Tax=Dibothriocephalus latus TaxID=60516 RepID=A0A3P7LIK0_DIBLA|nr:unnamed protein product [Dibothriocephalus latus]
MNFFLIFIRSFALVVALPFGTAFAFIDDLEEHGYYPAPRHYLRNRDGEIVFEDCFELTCHVGDFGGFGCREGYCDYICEPDGCYETKRLKMSEERYQSRSDFLGQLEIFGRVHFDGCNAKHCRYGEYEGYACNKGICGYVCKGTRCRSRLQKLSEDEYDDYAGEDDEDYDY